MRITQLSVISVINAFTRRCSFVCLFTSLLTFTAQAQDTPAKTETDGSAEITTTINVEPPPEITIGRHVLGRPSETKVTEDSILPQSLQTSGAKYLLKKRIDFIPFKYAPHQGDIHAPITIIEFADLSCIPCNAELEKADAQLASVIDKVQRYYVYTPAPASSPLQLADFYGKLAASENRFWEYRTRVIALDAPLGNAYFNILLKVGENEQALRRTATKNARKLYRELDIDAMISNQLRLGKSPFWLVNGVKVTADGAINVNQLKDLVTYEYKRLQRPKHLQ